MSDLELTDEEREEADVQVERIKAWLKSKEGASAVRRASEEAKRSAQRRREARRVDPTTLDLPVTI